MALAAFAASASCAEAGQTGAPAASAPVSAEAQALAESLLIVDTHIDAPYRHHRDPANLGASAPDRQFDYPRAKRGGLDVAFMSIYTPARVAEEGQAKALADTQIGYVEAMARDHPAKFAIATCTADVQALAWRGVLALALGMENGSPLAVGDAEATLEHFVESGIRYVTLAHSAANEYADSSYDDNERWQGLSAAGAALVAALNASGVMVDISHLSDRAAWQVLELSKTPVIASHSSLRRFTPGFMRNMSDEMFEALAAQGGVLQIMFGSGFVAAPARRWETLRSAAFAAEFGDETPPDTARRAFMDAYLAAHPYPFAAIDDVLAHIDHAVAVGGIDHVGIGSDFEGVGDTMPEGLKDAANFPRLIEGMLARGYEEDAIAKVMGRNLMRVWRDVEAFASEQGTPPRCRHAASTPDLSPPRPPPPVGRM